MVSLLPTKFHEILFSSFRGVALTNCVTDRWTDEQTDRWTDGQDKNNMSPHQSGARHNWRRGSQFTARHTKNRLQFDEWSPITLEWKIKILPSIQTVRLSIPITMRSLKWIGQGVLNLQCDIRKIAYNLMNKVQ
jgi:hypothetical protein